MGSQLDTLTEHGVDIDLKQEDRTHIASDLAHLLADTYTLYLKTQNYHWNVTGPMFRALHEMFEEQYKQLADAADVIAERIRALGFPAPASFREFAELASIAEAKGGKPPRPEEMVGQLLEGHEALARMCRAVFSRADDAEDQATADLAAERLAEHEKTAWMLRSTLHPA